MKRRPIRASGGWGGGGPVQDTVTPESGSTTGSGQSTVGPASYGRTWGSASAPSAPAASSSPPPSPPDATPMVSATSSAPAQRQQAASPPAQQQAAAMPAVVKPGGIYAAGGCSGLDAAMSEHADRLHPVRRR